MPLEPLYTQQTHQKETFEKRAICHCEEAKGRRSNPITIRKTIRLLRRCVPRNDRQNRNSKLGKVLS